jgi:hypothetical protein
LHFGDQGCRHNDDKIWEAPGQAWHELNVEVIAMLMRGQQVIEVVTENLVRGWRIESRFVFAEEGVNSHGDGR